MASNSTLRPARHGRNRLSGRRRTCAACRAGRSYPRNIAGWVVEPGSEQEAASVLSFANEAGLSIIPRGGGTKLQWGNPPKRADVILCLLRLNQVVEHAWADLTVTVEAGCTFAELQSSLARHGQRLAVDPLWPKRATIGGILATNDTGALRLCYGGLRDLVIGATLALADGTLARSGGKVVKNVAGYDLCKLSTGAMGTLGVVTRAVFRVHPLPPICDSVCEAGDRRGAPPHEPSQFQSDSGRDPSSMRRRGIAVDIGLEGKEAGLAAQEELQFLEVSQPSPVSHGFRLGSGWTIREELCAPSGTATVAKISVIPSLIAATLTTVAQSAAARSASWRAAIQATGIGWLRIEAEAESASAMLQELRAEIEAGGGALVVLQIPSTASGIDAWGNVGDALGLMLALKRQFDPQWTLNPGRYVGGI